MDNFSRVFHPFSPPLYYVKRKEPMQPLSNCRNRVKMLQTACDRYSLHHEMCHDTISAFYGTSVNAPKSPDSEEFHIAKVLCRSPQKIVGEPMRAVQ